MMLVLVPRRVAWSAVWYQLRGTLLLQMLVHVGGEAGCPVSCVATSVASAAAAPGTGRDPTQHIHLSGGDGKVKDM